MPEPEAGPADSLEATGDEAGGSNLDLVAGEIREILLAVAVGDRAGLDDPDRVVAHLPLGALDPGWLDALTRVVGEHRGMGPPSFRAALHPLPDRVAHALEEEVHLVDRTWLEAFAGLDEGDLEPIATAWLSGTRGLTPTRLDVALAAELLAAIVRFARRANAATAVLCVAGLPLGDLLPASGGG